MVNLTRPAFPRRNVPEQRMDDLLAAVSIHRPHSNHARPEEIITAVQSRSVVDSATAISQTSKAPASVSLQPASTATDALRLLRSGPDVEVLLITLRQLSAADGFEHGFTLHASGPIQAQIVNVLLDSIVPTFWPTLTTDDKLLLVSVLSTANGVLAVIGSIRLAVKHVPQDRSAAVLPDLLELANLLFRDDEVVQKLWRGLYYSIAMVPRNMSWKEIVNTLGSGKIVATIAQAEDAIRVTGSGIPMATVWLSRGSDYTSWLGRNIAHMLRSCDAHAAVFNDEMLASAQLLVKALNIGYSNALMGGFFTALSSHTTNCFVAMFSHVPAYAQRTLLEQALRWLSDTVADDIEPNEPLSIFGSKQTSSTAAQISLLTNGSPTMVSNLESMLSDTNFLTSLSLTVRRACLTILSISDSVDLTSVFERLSATFGDSLHINHATHSQQETLAQTLLLAAGHLHRVLPVAVLMTARSSGHMRGISNRLDCSDSRARWLGMVVATAMSGLVDKPGAAKLKFGTDDLESAEARWYQDLVDVRDTVGTFDDARHLLHKFQVGRPRRKTKPIKLERMQSINGKPIYGPVRPPQAMQTEVVGGKVTELLDSDGGDEPTELLKPHEKPDSDPEDSDEDATLVNRNKPRAPVYIRDLLRMLRDDKEPARFEMGIQQAAPLIRRKLDFGSEVKDHANELLGLLGNLQDPFATADFDELRLQAMIAIFVSDSATLGPWLSRRTFAGEFSIAQRCMILSTIGLGGRELAGFQSQDSLNKIPTASEELPSRRLPPRLHALYAGTSSSVRRLDSAGTDVERSLIQPMVLRAADRQTAGLNAVKVRTFSSRMTTESSKRRTPNNRLAPILGSAIFHPLISRFQQEIASYSSGSVWASNPILLVTLVKTLAILLHAAGPATADLREITSAFWGLLLGLRVASTGATAVLSSVLFGLLILLEVNSTTTDALQRLADEYAQQLIETQQWTEIVFARLGSGDSRGAVSDGDNGRSDEAKLRALAASVLVKTREVVEAYQKQLFGQVLE